MATGQWPTYADLTSRMTGAGKQAYIAEMLSQSIVTAEDMPVLESSEMGGHEFVLRTSLPAGYFRSANQGVPYSKSTTGKSRVGVGSLEDYSQVDRMIAEDSGDIDQFRENEDVAFLEGMGQTMEENVWYGNTTTNPAEFTGFSVFYNSISQAANGANILNGGGTGTSNASIWGIGWGQRTLFGVYPRGSKAGLTMEDKADTVPGFDSLGNRFEAYTSWFRHQLAIVPMDWRYAFRIPNIDVTSAGLAGPNALDIFATLAEAQMLPPHLSARTSTITKTDAQNDPAPGIRFVIYVNRTLMHWMQVQAIRDRQVLLRAEDYAGIPTDNWRGLPIKISDQLLTTESTIT